MYKSRLSSFFAVYLLYIPPGLERTEPGKLHRSSPTTERIQLGWRSLWSIHHVRTKSGPWVLVIAGWLGLLLHHSRNWQKTNSGELIRKQNEMMGGFPLSNFLWSKLFYPISNDTCERGGITINKIFALRLSLRQNRSVFTWFYTNLYQEGHWASLLISGIIKCWYCLVNMLQHCRLKMI